ncbi:MAG: 23S rRNA (uracil(1939)-C(5))-methyltransferase RlmD [Eubacterium sp.]|nr:23S rRNA (uracil(1939)-C(5))-methyltransferase RlmD [Eubacterium sp.]
MTVKKNQEYEVIIEAFGNSGEGISHINGYTLFVSGALPGERVKVAVTKAKKNYGYARLVSIEEPSPDRMEPGCPVAKRCGGCELQHMSYEAQLRFKVQRVVDCLTRLGGVSESAVAGPEVIGCVDEPWHYRNKAQFPVGVDRESRIAVGFYAARTHAIIPCGDCLIQSPVINRIKNVIEKCIDDADSVKHIYIRHAAATGQTMVCLVVPKKTAVLNRIKEAVLSEIKEVTSLCVNIHPDDTNVVLGDVFESLYGPLYIEDIIGDLRFRIAPESFYQVNPYITEKLYQKALEYAALTGEEIVWDLYCGIGTIGLFLSKKAKKVIGVEVVPQAVKNAKENADINSIENAEFYCGTAEDIISRAVGDKEVGRRGGGEATDAAFNLAELPDVVVVDPPRKGCDEKLIEAIGSAAPERIVYVSCDPATLSRDIARFRPYGYELEKACVVDQFWQTKHVETVALLVKRRKH